MPISKEIYWVETPLRNQHCGRCEYCKWDSCGQSWWCLCEESDWYEKWFDENEGDFYKHCEHFKSAKKIKDSILLLPKEEIYSYQKRKEPYDSFYWTESIRDDIFFCRHEKVAVYDIPHKDWFKYDSQFLSHYLHGEYCSVHGERCEETETYEEYEKYKPELLMQALESAGAYADNPALREA